ncbi:hypothetical protein jhhlp_001600 [Lomentospora prolificans]|uniref:Uncharacterized protein n=1 Tax=Lomentospora prolificans TaxID=41688 RepID=A0A2N3NIP4_9PEZI|nr:hypothetical protein jhhlp_001600 [Lomentospora prolificans]
MPLSRMVHDARISHLATLGKTKRIMGKKKLQSAPAVATDKVIPLNNFDSNDVNSSIVLYLLFRFDDVLDPEKLCAALEKLMNRDGWRKLGARLRQNEAGELEYHVPEKYDESRPAFTYGHVTHDMPIEKHPLGSKLPRGYTGEGPGVLLDPTETEDLMGATKGPRTLADYVEHDKPQIGLHIVSFTDATLVTLNWLHTLWDAMGRSEFLHAWMAVLDGREDEVKPFLGFDTNPLQELGLHPKETYELADRRLSIPQLIVFGIRRALEQILHKDEGHVICIPGKFLQGLREKSLAELKEAAAASGDGKGEEDIFISDGDLILAWLGRTVVKHHSIRGSRTVSLFNAFGMRGLLAKDLLPPSSAYVANAVSTAYTLIPARDIINRPLSYTASRVRQTLKVQGTRGQLEACLALIKETYDKTGYPALFGDATMQLVIVSNWSKAKFFEIDFSSAIVDKADAAPEAMKRRGRPVYIQPFAYSDYSTRCAFNVSGKDADGNYWLTGALRKEGWVRLKEALKRGEYY